eukprot:1895041-Prymnesium_polylepis.1
MPSIMASDETAGPRGGTLRKASPDDVRARIRNRIRVSSSGHRSAILIRPTASVGLALTPTRAVRNLAIQVLVPGLIQPKPRFVRSRLGAPTPRSDVTAPFTVRGVEIEIGVCEPASRFLSAEEKFRHPPADFCQRERNSGTSQPIYVSGFRRQPAERGTKSGKVRFLRPPAAAV